jgi:hypothetical protein
MDSDSARNLAIGIGTAIGAFVIVIARPVIRSLRRRDSADPKVLNDVAVIDIRIQELIYSLRKDVGACRAGISFFENGTHFYDGSSTQTLRTVYESVESGVDSLKSSLTGISTSLTPNLIRAMMDDTPLVNVTTDMTDGYSRSLFIGHDVEAFICQPIRYNRARISGWLLLTWRSETEARGNIKAENIKGAIAQIESLLLERYKACGEAKH